MLLLWLLLCSIFGGSYNDSSSNHASVIPIGIIFLYQALQDSQYLAPLPIRQWGNTINKAFNPTKTEKNAFLKGFPSLT